MTTPRLATSRSYALVLIGVLAVHAWILVAAAARAFVGRPIEDYDLWSFAIAFPLSWALLRQWERHAPAVVFVSLLIAAAALTSPGAVALVATMVLNAYIVGGRLLGWARAGKEEIEPALPFSITALVGWAAWLGLISLTASLKVHYPPVYAGALILPILLGWRRVAGLVNGIRQSLVRPERPVTGTERVWLALLLTIAILHLFVVAKPEVGYDAQAVHMQFAALLADQHRWPHDVARYAWAVMPLGADFAYASAFILGGGEQAARLLNLVFGVFALRIVFVLVRREASREVALASVCLFASMPLAYLETGSLFVENLWCAFLLGALLLALDFARTRSTAAFLALAFLAAGALQTKAIAVVWLAPILAALALASRRPNVPKLGRRGAVLLAIALVIAAFPYVNAWLRTGNPLFPFFNNVFPSPYFESRNFYNPVYQTPLRIDSIYTLFISSGKFVEGFDGAAGFHWLLLLPIIALGFTRRRPAMQWLSLLLAVIFFVVVYSQQAYLRYLLPFLLLVALLGGWMLGDIVRAPATRVALAVLGGTLVVTNVLLMNTGVWWNDTLCTGCALGQGARTGYVARYSPDRVVAQYLTDTVPTGRVGFFVVNAPGASGFTGYSRAANWHDVRVYRKLVDANTANDVLAIARRYGLTHAVVLDATQDSVSPIAAFRDAYTVPLWSFNGYVVAAIKPPSP